MFVRRFASARLMGGASARNYAKSSFSARTHLATTNVAGSNEQV